MHRSERGDQPACAWVRRLTPQLREETGAAQRTHPSCHYRICKLIGTATEGSARRQRRHVKADRGTGPVL